MTHGYTRPLIIMSDSTVLLEATHEKMDEVRIHFANSEIYTKSG